MVLAPRGRILPSLDEATWLRSTGTPHPWKSSLTKNLGRASGISQPASPVLKTGVLCATRRWPDSKAESRGFEPRHAALTACSASINRGQYQIVAALRCKLEAGAGVEPDSASLQGRIRSVRYSRLRPLRHTPIPCLTGGIATAILRLLAFPQKVPVTTPTHALERMAGVSRAAAEYALGDKSCREVRHKIVGLSAQGPHI